MTGLTMTGAWQLLSSFLTTASSSSNVLRLVKMSVFLALHLLTVLHIANNSLKSHISMLFHFLNEVVEHASYCCIISLLLSIWLACYCWFDSMAPFLCFYLMFHLWWRKIDFRVPYSLILCLVNFQYVERSSMTNININTNTNTNVNATMSQFTVSPPSYNVKISVCGSLLCFCFGPEIVVLVMIFFFGDLALCGLFSWDLVFGLLCQLLFDAQHCFSALCGARCLFRWLTAFPPWS